MYEYKYTQIEADSWSKDHGGYAYQVSYSHEPMQKVLDLMGQLGWRLVTVAPSRTIGSGEKNILVLFWEREKK